MNFEFKLPDLGEGLVEGEIVKWFVKVGETVKENQPLAAVLTDKAEVEIPSPKTGTVVKLFGKPGEKVKVHAPLAVFEVGEGAAAIAPVKPNQKTSETQKSLAAPVSAAPAQSRRRETDVLAAPMVRKMAKDAGIDLTQIMGTGPAGRVLEKDLKNFASHAATSARRATPAVKALAASLGVDLSALTGTGPGGRIVEGDVHTASSKSVPPKLASGAASQTEQRVPFVGIRRKIAEKMQFSTRTVAHVTHMDECDMTALISLRDELKAQAAKRSVKLTFLPFIIKALTKTLAEFPIFNSSLVEEAGEIVVKRHYNVGIAVAAPQGLLVPNIKSADSMDLLRLAEEVAKLAEKVRASKIDIASLQGGTITITNIGPIGGLFATPIVNHPEVAILGLMKLQKRPMVRDGNIAIRDMMNLVLSFDHRVADGAEAANFMNTLIQHLENPRTLV